jgi:hypothetical protein
MSRSWDYQRKRLLSLLAELAVFGLEGSKRREFTNLMAALPDFDAECMDRAAAVVVLAGSAERLEPLPSRLRSAIRRTASDYLNKLAGRDRESQS